MQLLCSSAISKPIQIQVSNNKDRCLAADLRQLMTGDYPILTYPAILLYSYLLGLPGKVNK